MGSARAMKFIVWSSKFSYNENNPDMLFRNLYQLLNISSNVIMNSCYNGNPLSPLIV